MKHLVTYQREVDKGKSNEKADVSTSASLLRRRANVRNVSFSKFTTAITVEPR